MANGKVKSRRTNLFINPKFQTRFSFFVCSWILTLSLVFPIIISRLFEFFESFCQINCKPGASVSLLGIKNETLQLLYSFEAVFVLCVFLIGIFVSHRVAGPVYKLQRAMEKVREGQLGSALEFRKGDNFQEVADDFNRMMGAVREIVVHGRDSLVQATSRVENAMDHADEEGRTQLKHALVDLKKLLETTQPGQSGQSGKAT